MLHWSVNLPDTYTTTHTDKKRYTHTEHTYGHINRHTHTQRQTCTHRHTDTHTHIYPHTYTHTHTCTKTFWLVVGDHQLMVKTTCPSADQQSSPTDYCLASPACHKLQEPSEQLYIQSYFTVHGEHYWLHASYNVLFQGLLIICMHLIICTIGNVWRAWTSTGANVTHTYPV